MIIIMEVAMMVTLLKVIALLVMIMKVVTLGGQSDVCW